MDSLTKASRPRTYEFRLGAFKAAALLDAVDRRDGLRASFAVDQPPADVKALAKVNFLDTDEFEHPFIPTLVDTGTHKILFDTGVGILEGGQLLDCLEAVGLRAADIDIVVITHGHPDHVGGLVSEGVPVFCQARHYFGNAEYKFWAHSEDVRDIRLETRDLFLQACRKLEDRIVLIEPGQEVVPGIVAIDAGGHSPGMMAYRIESEGKSLLIWSDALLHYVISIQRPAWHAHFDDNKEEAVRTRQRLLEMAASQRLLVAGFHMPFPGLGFVEATAGSFRWIPVSYQLNL